MMRMMWCRLSQWRSVSMRMPRHANLGASEMVSGAAATEYQSLS